MGAVVEQTLTGWRLSIPAGDAGHYRLAQLDNCSHLARRDFPYRSLDMRLRARISSRAVPGTWGFGVWNDPYRATISLRENPLHMLTLPNAAWFFHSSPDSYLSFRDDKPGQGFLAQVFCAHRRPLFRLLGVAGTFIFARAAARRMLSRLIAEYAVTLNIDVTQWHSYRVSWNPDRVVFEVDDIVLLESEVSPQPPLGAVIWIDNQFAAFTPQGRVASGTLANPSTRLEIEALVLKT